MLDKMKKLSITILILMITSLVYAENVNDLSDFPDNFINSKKFNGYIVVGKGGSALDVISQGIISMKISDYLNSPQQGINKLDDEIDLDHNLILIGSPCVNKLAAELLGNPTDCSEDFPAGKATILYLEKNDNKYILVAGSTDKETRKAAEYLVNFKMNDLKGNDISIDLGTSKAASTKITGISLNSSPDKVKNLTQSQIVSSIQNDEKIIGAGKNDALTTEQAKSSESNPNSNADSKKIVVVEDKNILVKIIDWVKGLFGK